MRSFAHPAVLRNQAWPVGYCCAGIPPRSTVERAIRITRHGGDDGRRPMFCVAVTQKGVSLIDPLPVAPRAAKQARTKSAPARSALNRARGRHHSRHDLRKPPALPGDDGSPTGETPEGPLLSERPLRRNAHPPAIDSRHGTRVFGSTPEGALPSCPNRIDTSDLIPVDRVIQ
jgi:hypothetical protein